MPETQRCAACKRPLSRYNPDPLCSSCLRAARYGSDDAETTADGGGLTPVWLWDSPPMRRALSRPDPGAMLVIFRAATGLSQLELGDIMGWSQSTVSLIEKGRRETLFDIRELRRFADLFVIPWEALFPLMLGCADRRIGDRALDDAALPGPGNVEDADLDVDRRTFGGLAAGMAASIMLPETTVPPTVTRSHIRYLQACADSLCERDQAVGGAAQLRQALVHWRYARRMLDEADYSQQVGLYLMSAAGTLALRAGWACYDCGEQVHARRLYADALLLAQQAEDDTLAVHAMVNMSLQLAHLARDERPGLARQAIQLCDRAVQLARRDPTPKLHALIAAREATAWAALGDVRGFRTALSRSWRELDRGDTSDEPTWLNFVRPAEITAHEAKGRASLGDTGGAADLYRQSLNAQDVSRRNRACYHTRLASALADCGAITDAINEGLAVLPVLEGPVSSPRALRELRPVRTAAERHGNEEFCARFDAVCDAEAI